MKETTPNSVQALCPHIDLANPNSYQTTPFEWFKELRRDHPVIWHEDPNTGVGFWALTKREDLDYVSRNPALFSSAERGCAFNEVDEEQMVLLRNMILNMDPPDHIGFRKLIATAFKPRTIEAMEPFIRETARGIVDKVAHKGECEFVADVAMRLPMATICHLVGADLADADMIMGWADAALGANDPDLPVEKEDLWEATAQIFAYSKMLADKYRDSDAENLTVTLISANVDGEALTDEQFGYFFFLLLIAGIETTRTATTSGMKLMIENPDQLQKILDDPSLIPHAVEEVLRYDAPVIQFRRTAMEDVELRGKKIKKGDKVVFYYSSANHDEDVFDEPEKFDVTRGVNSNLQRDHRAFGTGEHFCLGAHLARLQLRVMYEEMFPRLCNPKFAGEYKRLNSYDVTAPKSMPISFDAE